MTLARVLPLVRRHNVIRHGILVTAVFPLSIATFSAYHAIQSPFFMPNKPFESWNHGFKSEKLYSTHSDHTPHHTERPYFEYNV